VAPSRRADFDRAADALGENGSLYRLSLEYPPDPDPRPAPARPGVALTLRRPDGTCALLAVVEGHLHWIDPLQF
jgi:hypothetical protein